MMLAWSYFESHPESFEFDEAEQDYVLKPDATPEAKQYYSEYQTMKEYMEQNGLTP